MLRKVKKPVNMKYKRVFFLLEEYPFERGRMMGLEPTTF